MPINKSILLQAVLDSSREGIAVVDAKELLAANNRACALLQCTPTHAPPHLPNTTISKPLPPSILKLAQEIIASGHPAEVIVDSINVKAKGTPCVEVTGEAFAVITVEELAHRLTSPGAYLWNALADKTVRHAWDDRQWANLFADHWPMPFMCCEWHDEASEFTYLAVNDACLKAFGLKNQSDLVGKTTSQLGWPKEETARWAAQIRALPEGVSAPVAMRTRMPDGMTKLILNTGIRCKDPNGSGFRFFHSLQDITDQQRIQDELEEERKKLRQTVDELQVLKMLYDKSPLGMGLMELSEDRKDLHFLYVNPIVERILSASSGLATMPPGGWTLSACTHNAGFATNSLFLQGAETCSRTNQCRDVEVSGPGALTGKMEWWKCYFVPLTNTRVGYMARDITHQKNLEAMLRKQGEELERAVHERTRDLEEALQVKNRFLAVVSHEIRTPISGVLGSMELLAETELSEEQLPLLRTARTCGEQLSNVIDDILDICKIQEKRIEICNEEFCFRELLEDLMDITVYSVGRRTIELILDYDETAPEWVVGDIVRIRQILINILSNAVKFTEAGEVYVSVTTEQPALANPQPTQRTVLVQVRDTGIGIPAAVQSKIFQPFSQADSSVNRKFGGSGLGLSISKHLAQLMNGDLTFVSNPDSGPGTTFTLRFPTTVRFMLTMPLKIAPRVVVVEQCATLRRVLTKRLKALACNVQAFDSLAAARPSLQQCAPPPAAASSASEAESADEVLGSTTTGKRKSVDSNFSSQLQPASSETILLVDSCTEGQSLSNIQSVMPWLRVIFMGYNTAKQASLPFLNKPIRRASLRAALLAASDPRGVNLLPGKKAFKGNEKDSSTWSRNLKILVAEDNPSNQLIIRKYLELLGYNDVKVVENGQQALTEALTARYDVVLMDLMMPIMSGIEASEHIHSKMSEDKRPYVVALTASAFEEDKQKCLRAGMQAVLTKPLNRTQLEQVLNQRMLECVTRGVVL